MRMPRIFGAALFGAVALVGLAGPASARVFVGIGVGLPLFAPWYYPPAFYAPPYIPPAVAYAPPPVVYQQPAFVAPQGQVWYYCDSPRGYYPYVSSCGQGWRTVPAAPPRTGQ